MPLLKKILKATPSEVVVKWTGSGSDTLTLASLVSGSQTVTGNTAATIDSLSVTSSGATTVTRNAEIAFQVNGNWDFNMGPIGFSHANENQGSDIVVNMVAVGTLVLRVRKVNGYSAPAPF